MQNNNRKISGSPLISVCITEKGFTLFEILLAFFIFSILFITIYTSYSGSFKTINMTEDRMELYRKAATPLERISEDIQATYISALPPNSFGQPAGYTRFLGEDTMIDGRDAHSISFFSRVSPLFGDDDATVSGQLLSYSVIQGREEDEFILLRSEYPEFIDETGEKGGLVLADGLQAITFTYFDEDGEPHEQWDSDSEEFSGRLPRVVTVSLEFLNYENPDAPFKVFTSVAIPVNYRPKLLGEGSG